MSIITEEMRYRQKLCEFAKKYGVTKAARRYHTNRQFVYRQLKKYDGTVRSLALGSRRPLHSPNAHTKSELKLIRKMLKRNGIYGLAEVYVRCKAKGYTRSFSSMCRQIRNKGYKKPEIRRKSYTKYDRMDGKYPGDKVQVDIKYVPNECIKFTYETKKFLEDLEEMMGFPIHIVQVDNGHEFVNDNDKTSKESAFEKAAYNLGITIKRTRPYSPWQNGKVERSHREDGKVLYNRKVFTSEKDLINQVAKHERRYNSTAKTSLKFKSPDEVVEEYFKNTSCYYEN